MVGKPFKKVIKLSLICSLLPYCTIIFTQKKRGLFSSANHEDSFSIQHEKHLDEERFAQILQLPWLSKDNKKIYTEPGYPIRWNMRVVLNEKNYSSSEDTSAASVVLVWNAQKGQVNQQFKALIKKIIHPFKRIGYIPGIEQISMKTKLAKHNLPCTPKSYFLPVDKKQLMDDFRKYPFKHFLLKGDGHGHIQLLNDTSVIDSYTFGQELIEPPFLIDGYKFDISQHVVITSVNPLRVHMLDNVLIRFFKLPYKEQLATIVQEEPASSSTARRLNGADGMSMKEMFSKYMRNRGHDPEVIYHKMRAIIEDTLQSIEPLLIKEFNEYKPAPGQMYQHTRWDFFLKDNLDVYLIEVNDSPFLGSTSPESSVIRQKETATSILRLAGVLNPDLIINFDDLNLSSDICYSNECKHNCFARRCALCFRCITQRTISDIALAYREHISNSGFKRILPSTKNCLDSMKTVLEDWYCKMCAENKTFCTE